MVCLGVRRDPTETRSSRAAPSASKLHASLCTCSFTARGSRSLRRRSVWLHSRSPSTVLAGSARAPRVTGVVTRHGSHPHAARMRAGSSARGAVRPAWMRSTRDTLMPVCTAISDGVRSSSVAAQRSRFGMRTTRSLVRAPRRDVVDVLPPRCPSALTTLSVVTGSAAYFARRLSFLARVRVGCSRASASTSRSSGPGSSLEISARASCRSLAS